MSAIPAERCARPCTRILILAPEGPMSVQIEATVRGLGAIDLMHANVLNAAAGMLRRHSFDIVVAQVDSEFSDGLRLPSMLKEMYLAKSGPMPHVLWAAFDAHLRHQEGATAIAVPPANVAGIDESPRATSLAALEALARLARTAGVHVSVFGNPGAATLQAAISRLFDPSPDKEEVRLTPPPDRIPTEDDVVDALTTGEGMRVVYQPQFDLRSKAMTGAEALLCWRHAVLGEVAPAVMLPIVHRLGLDLLLFSFIERHAVHTLTQLEHAGVPVTLAVNASPNTVCAPGLVERLALKMQRAGLPNDRLIIEITEESADFDVLQLSAAITALRTRGFQVSLDDFGSGSATLALLSHTPFDELKIDGALVRACLSAPRSCHVIAGIAELARTMDMRLVAEGIEDASAMAPLLRLGCHIGQGYALARPLEGAEFMRRALASSSEAGTTLG